jgi:hypothetical protein
MSHTNLSTSSFKLFLLKFLLPFILLISGTGFLFGYFFEKEIILNSTISGAYKVNRIINETNPGEIPIFGSSRAESSYIPDSLGKIFFNYGLNGTGPDVMLFFMKEECKKKKTTPYLILNFDMTGFIHPIGDLSNYIYNSGYTPVKELLSKDYKISYSIPFIKYYGQYESYLKYYVTDKINFSFYTNKGAYMVRKNGVSRQQFKDMVNLSKHSVAGFAIDTVIENEYIRVIKMNPERVFVFVVSPYHSSFFEKFKNPKDATDFFNRLSKMNNVRVLDFGRVKYPDSLFSDPMHLNYNGAIRFSREFKDTLNKIPINNF